MEERVEREEDNCSWGRGGGVGKELNPLVNFPAEGRNGRKG